MLNIPKISWINLSSSNQLIIPFLVTILKCKDEARIVDGHKLPKFYIRTVDVNKVLWFLRGRGWGWTGVVMWVLLASCSMSKLFHVNIPTSYQYSTSFLTRALLGQGQSPGCHPLHCYSRQPECSGQVFRFLPGSTRARPHALMLAGFPAKGTRTADLCTSLKLYPSGGLQWDNYP